MTRRMAVRARSAGAHVRLAGEELTRREAALATVGGVLVALLVWAGLILLLSAGGGA